MTASLTPRARRSYALGSVATGTFGTVPGLLLLPYLTDTLGVAALIAGAIVFVPKAWDVVLNPIAGRISDRSTSPRGRRRLLRMRERVRRYPLGTVDPAKAGGDGIRAQLRLVARVTKFRRPLLTFVLQALATGAMLAAVDYVARNPPRITGKRAAVTGAVTVGPIEVAPELAEAARAIDPAPPALREALLIAYLDRLTQCR